jgi:uracil-DNA glycosylase
MDIRESWKDLDFSVIDKLEKSGVKYVPSRDKVFSMFDMLDFYSVKVVIMGSEAYHQHCPVSRVRYACGPSFLIPEESLTCPLSLKNLFKEIRSDVGCPKSLSLKQIKTQSWNWIKQGVFLTNVSLTRGLEGTYLDDHRMVWMSFIRTFLEKVSHLDCPIVLLGKESWELERYITHQKILKLYHPVNRNGLFFGSKMFSKINSFLSEPIVWFHQSTS